MPRKRKPGPREPNGRPKRPTVQQIKDTEAERYRENMRQIAAQPHRRWASDPLDRRLENALGRFCVRKGLRDELYHAGREYADLMRRWLAAKGAPDPMHSNTVGSGQGPSDATVAAWWRQIESIEAELKRCGGLAYLAVRTICLEDLDLTPEVDQDAVAGLVSVAVATGWIKKGHGPFPDAA